MLGSNGKQLKLRLGTDMTVTTRPSSGIRVAGLFAGIGGGGGGAPLAGHTSEMLCEWDASAQRVLRARFPEIPLAGDVRELRSLPSVDLLSAGFPCQDLSQAGMTAGIRGERSGLVSEVFRLLDKARPRWLLLENVPFMLQLDRGEAMRYLTSALRERGYRWAYRVVDSRAFGLPQRRQRVLVLASRTEDPRPVLFADDVGDPPTDHPFCDANRLPPLNGAACGFYWTEGVRGLGWAVDATPTLKGGSTVGIPSPPAILLPSGEVITPDIRDAERLQGFPANWTEPAVDDPSRRNGPRWKLVGNAVSVPVFRWVGERLAKPGSYQPADDPAHVDGAAWPKAAWCMDTRIHAAEVSPWPKRLKTKPLEEFLRYPGTPLSLRATRGFQDRTQKGSLRFPKGFLEAVEAHARRMERVDEVPRRGARA